MKKGIDFPLKKLSALEMSQLSSDDMSCIWGGYWYAVEMSYDHHAVEWSKTYYYNSEWNQQQLLDKFDHDIMESRDLYDNYYSLIC